MNERLDTPHYQGSSATIIGWLLVLAMIFGGTLLCLSLSLGVAVIFGG